MNIEEKIAQTEAEVYRTVQALDWVAENIGDADVNLDELRVTLDQIAVSPSGGGGVDAWASVPVIGAARHAGGNLGIYTFPVDGGAMGYVFVRCSEFLEWDRRRKFAGEYGAQWPEHSLLEDLQAFHASPASQEVTA